MYMYNAYIYFLGVANISHLVFAKDLEHQSAASAKSFSANCPMNRGQRPLSRF